MQPSHALALMLLVGCAAPTAPPPDDDAATPTPGDDDDSATPPPPVDADGDGSPLGEDCDDADAAVFPGAEEICDGRDTDCDGAGDPPAPICVLAPSDPCPFPLRPPAPAPLLALPFEAADPAANLGSLPAADYVVQAATFAPGPGAVGQGASFTPNTADPNANPQLRIGYTPALHPSTFTVAAWIRPTSRSERTLVANTLWDSDFWGFSFDVAWGWLSLRLGDGTALATAQVPLQLDRWTHAAATYDGEVVTLLLDGVVAVRQPIPAGWGPYVPSPYSRFVVGGYQNAYAYPYQGAIDELRFWGEALPASAIARAFAGERFDAEDGVGCGPSGAYRDRAVGDAPDVLAAPALGAKLDLSLWARPDALAGTLAERPGAFALRLVGEELVGEVVGENGTVGVVRAPAPPRTFWSHLRLSFDGLRLRLFVDGVQQATSLPGFFALAGAQGDVLLGEGFAGGLDAVALADLAPPGPFAPPVLLALDGMDRTADAAGLPLAGPLAAALAGEAEDHVLDDPEHACSVLHAEQRVPCAHRRGAGLAATAPALMGPLSVQAELRVLAQPAEEFELLAFGDALSLRLGPTGLALVEGAARAELPILEGSWRRITASVTATSLAVSIDGGAPVVAARAAPTDPYARFPLVPEGAALTLTTDAQGGAAWIQHLALLQAAPEEEARLRWEAPWRLETHPSLPAHDDEVVVNGSWWWADLAQGDLDLLATPSGDVRSEEWWHHDRAVRARRLAEAARTGAGADPQEAFAGALALLDNLDAGRWYWSWGQGGTLRDYAAAYDLLVPLLAAREADDPATFAPLHRRIRRRLLAAAWQIAAWGGIAEQGYPEAGLHHYEPGWIGANSRLRVLAGTGTVGLALPLAEEPRFGSARDLLQLTTDDLFEDRGAGGAALGRHLLRYHEPGGRYNEGAGYQSDVYSIMAPFLLDLRARTGVDRVTQGVVFDMFECSVATMMPSGDPLLYGTGNLGYVPHHPLLARHVPARTARYEWFYARQFDPTATGGEPPFTSARCGADTAALRSGWDEEALYVSLLGRQAAARGSHSQRDQLSLSLMWRGAFLLIDPGDGRDYRGTSDAAEEPWLQSDLGHNNVLVDGEGPGIVYSLTELVDPAGIVASLFAPRTDYVAMEGTIGGGLAAGGAEHTRRLLLLDDRVVVVHDAVAAPADAVVETQWHLGGPLDGGDGVLTALDDASLTWETTKTAGADVGLAVASVAAPGATTSSLGWGGTNFLRCCVWDHPFVRFAQVGEAVDALTLLLPFEPGVDAPAVEVLLAEDERRAARVTGLPTGPVVVALNRAGGTLEAGGIATDALLAAAHRGGWAFLAEGSALDDGQGLAAEATCALDALALRREGAARLGDVSRAPGPCALSVGLPAAPTSALVDGAPAVAIWDAAAGRAVLDPAPLVSFRLE